MPFWEGQSYGVIPPGTKINSKGKEVPHGVRLYSIASTRYGDSFDGQTATLCVRRATYCDEEKAAEAKSLPRRVRESAIDTSDVFGTILGINSLLFYVVSTAIFTGALIFFTDLTRDGSLILGFTLSTTLTFSLLDDFWDAVGKVPLKALSLIHI